MSVGWSVAIVSVHEYFAGKKRTEGKCFGKGTNRDGDGGVQIEMEMEIEM